MSAIAEYVADIRIIDAHEHLRTSEFRANEKLGLFDLLHYYESDLIAAGMPRGSLVRSEEADFEDQIKTFQKYFERSKNTAYARAFRLAMRDLYQFDDWSVDGLVRLNQEVLRRSQDASWYDSVVKEHSGIDLMLNLIQRTSFTWDAMRPIMFLDYYWRVESRDHVRNIEELAGRSIDKLSHYLDCLGRILDAYVKQGVVAVKLNYSYRRGLRVGRPTFHDAEQVFNRIMRLRPGHALSQEELVALQDYLIHEFIQGAIVRGLPIQIHTGHQEPSVTGDGNVVSNSEVTDLVPLLLEYPKAKFILLHAGVPYFHEYMSVVKNFPNVYADMTWVYVISPSVASQALHEMIEMVPWSKIQGFGGDYNNVEGVYGHSKIARGVLSKVLDTKVTEGYFSTDEAQIFARRVFRENVLEMYGLEL